MLSRGQRITSDSPVVAFPWGATPPARSASAPQPPPPPAPVKPAPSPESMPDVQARVAKLERDAFATGHAQGEKAGLEAGSKRADAMLRRLAETLQELEELRRSMLRQTEQQVVQLSLAIAKRILRREVAADQDLLCALARVALDRLGNASPAKVRLHPDDHAAVTTRHGHGWAGTHVVVEADASVSRGGCLVESPFGFVDASVDAQFRVLEEALVAEDATESRLAGARGR